MRMSLAVLLALGVGLATAAAADTPARPKLEAACKTVADCAFTHYDEVCCFECSVTVGSGRWVGAVEKICGAHPGKGCRVPACGQAHVELTCVDGRCARK